MKNNLDSMKNLSLALLIIFSLGAISEISAQDRIPREYNNPEEVISFDRRTSFPEAIDVITTFAQDFENKFVINKSGYTGTIGVTLPAMHWREALGYILRVQNLVLLETDDFLEIVTQEAADARFAEDDPAVVPSRATGTSTAEMEELRLKVNTGTREVRINATFFEGNKGALREIGVDWSTLTSATPANIGDFLGEDSNETLPNQLGDAFVNVNSRGARNVSQSVFDAIVNFGEIGEGIEVQALFSAFESDNIGEILATPSIRVMNGEEGTIQVGQDFSIKQRDFAGNVTDQFYQSGTILKVTPQIVDYGDTTLIYLELETERSTVLPDPVSTIINKQEANTHALLLDGESTVIAGLYRTEESNVRRGIPILKDLPGWFFGLKYLFGFNSTDIEESELIILLQAELEESIPQRAARRFKSQNELFQEQQTNHRQGMNRAGANPLAPNPPPEKEPPVEIEDERRTSILQDPIITEEAPQRQEEPQYQPPVTQNTDVDIDDMRAQIERRRITEGQIERNDISQYAGQWRSMELENMNGGYDSLEFYVIGGSFQVKDNADRLYESFKEQGFDAHMLYNPATDFYFVAYAGFETPDEAIPYLIEVQQTLLDEAWLSRIIKEKRLDYNGR